MTTRVISYAANDNDMTASRKIAVLEQSVGGLLDQLEDAARDNDGSRQVALMTLIVKQQRRIFELSRGAL